jgi:DNA invertase Pin-like site-specific DNA recombinase
MAEGKFISYLRVSRESQGRSGLGLEAQRAAVASYLNGGQWSLVREYIEVETSTGRVDRPKLRAALSHAKSLGATLVFAKLDRLFRNAKLLLTLIDSGADVVFCDLPHIPAGAVGRFMLTQLAAVAELEAGLISERTKAALAAAKARGVKLGNPNGARALRGKQMGNKEAVAAVKANAQHHAESVMERIEEVRREMGATSLHAIAAALNERGVRTPRGGQWYAASVQRVLERVGD